MKPFQHLSPGHRTFAGEGCLAAVSGLPYREAASLVAAHLDGSACAVLDSGSSRKARL